MVPSVLVGCFGREAWVRVEGRGTFQNSAGLKEFSKQMIQKGFRKFVVDLKKCELMDSTFMGTLAGIALRLQEMGQGTMSVINVNTRNFDLLKNLGLDHLFDVFSPSDTHQPHSPEKTSLQETQAPVKPDTIRETIYDAHKALIEAQPEKNADLFKDVVAYLKQEKSDSETP